MSSIPQDDLAYDNTSAPSITETYTLERLIELGSEAALLECRVAMPCRVTALNADGSVNVLPGITTRFVGRAEQNLPELQHIPISSPQGADFAVVFPVAVGDTGYCLVMDRCIDAWLAADGSPQSPGDVRAHHLSDAIFVPMLTTDAARKTDAGTDLVLQNGSLTMRLKKSGQLSVKNGSQELINVVDQLVQANVALTQALQQAMCLTPLGPAPFTVAAIAAFAQVQASLQNIRGETDTFLSP